jgi:tRNA wybutosine-synthesizing protein 1
MESHILSILALGVLLYLGGKIFFLILILSLTALFYFSPTTSTTITATSRSRKGKSKVIAPDLAKLKKANPNTDIYTSNKSTLKESPIYIFYSSLTGSSKRVALQLYNTLVDNNNNIPKDQINLLSIDDDLEDLDSYFLNIPNITKDSKTFPIYILILPSYESDSPIDYFLEFLQDTATDFRVDKYPLKSLSGFAALGLGDSESWPELFCYQSKLADKWLSKLGARRIFPLGQLCIKNNFKENTDNYINRLINVLNDNEPILYEEFDPEDSDLDSDLEYHNEEEDDDEDNSNCSSNEGTLVDMEDLSKGEKSKNQSTLLSKSITRKQMVAKNSPTYKSLTKQGYTVVGSHSGVKICRWTKSALRGRGFCYKFAFYGINSHRCMETTPSLSCSNKCVFCWRHGTNPVGTTWRWEVDKPDLILNGALNGHYNKIKQMRGVPGVLMDRFEEAFKVRHCALSLVGEPIFYPYINEFLNMLHEKEISSFLVCNAQHPDQLKTLNKVTQLYVSIDAPTKQELKVVDRPLFRDYWERLESCLDILRTVQSHQRTVFRLTLVKGFNMSESDIGGYANLVERGLPSLIEIKGATYCGSSEGNGNPLTMQNIPFYEECVSFVKKLDMELNNRNLNYGLAAEHSHSCCFLIASKKFFINDQWFTHIDYDKFFKLIQSKESFDKMDYIAKTPEWAYFGSEQGGFNPADTRFNRKEEKLKKKLERENQNDNNINVKK